VTTDGWGVLALTVMGTVAVARDLIALRRQLVSRCRSVHIRERTGQRACITVYDPDKHVEVEATEQARGLRPRAGSDDQPQRAR
jgi:hypothetical protein